MNHDIRLGNGQMLTRAIFEKIMAEHAETERYLWTRMARMVDRDPDHCCWPRCSDPCSKRYGVPLCDSHAKMIAGRIDHIDAKWRQSMPLGVALDLEDLRQTVTRQQAEIALLRDGPPRAKARPPTMGIVYFVQVGAHIKIGWTSDLANRMHDYPPNTVLLATHPGKRKDEQRLHKMFAVHRSHGREWYPLVPVILDHIKRVVAEHGAPVVVGFGAKPTEVPQPRQRQYVGGDRIGNGSTPRMVRG